MRPLARKLKHGYRRARFEVVAPLVDSVPHYWLSGPPDCTEQKVCIFVTYAPNGSIPEHAKFHYEAWKAAGYVVAVVICLDDISQGICGSIGDVTAAMIRQNRGYDFGAWSNAISSIPTLRDAQLCVISNDSVYGPLHSIESISEKIISAKADFVGLVSSAQKSQHFQSFLLAFGPKALNSKFWDIWRRVREGGREDVILNYELRLLNRARRFGLSTKSLYSSDNPYLNPTLSNGIDLIRDGFPYIKVQLLRENPHNSDISNWRNILSALNYDVEMIDRHLKRRTFE